MCTVVDRMKENELKRTPQKIRLQRVTIPMACDSGTNARSTTQLILLEPNFFRLSFQLLKFINNSKDLILFRCSEKVTFVKFSHKPEIKGTQTQDIKATAKLLKSIGQKFKIFVNKNALSHCCDVFLVVSLEMKKFHLNIF